MNVYEQYFCRYMSSFWFNWGTERRRFLLLINENNWQTSEPSECSYECVYCTYEYPDRLETICKGGSLQGLTRQKMEGWKTDADGLDIAYLKAIITESNYWINGITRYQRGLAPYQFLMRISQCWIDWVRIIKCQPSMDRSWSVAERLLKPKGSSSSFSSESTTCLFFLGGAPPLGTESAERLPLEEPVLPAVVCLSRSIMSSSL